MSELLINEINNNDKNFTLRKPITKRDLLTMLYKEFLIELNKIQDLSYIFPSIDDVDIGDIVFKINYIFLPGCNLKMTIEELICLYNVKITEETVNKIVPLVESFLQRFRSI